MKFPQNFRYLSGLLKSLKTPINTPYGILHKKIISPTIRICALINFLKMEGLLSNKVNESLFTQIFKSTFLMMPPFLFSIIPQSIRYKENEEKVLKGEFFLNSINASFSNT